MMKTKINLDDIVTRREIADWIYEYVRETAGDSVANYMMSHQMQSVRAKTESMSAQIKAVVVGQLVEVMKLMEAGNMKSEDKSDEEHDDWQLSLTMENESSMCKFYRVVGKSNALNSMLKSHYASKNASPIIMLRIERNKTKTL